MKKLFIFVAVAVMALMAVHAWADVATRYHAHHHSCVIPYQNSTSPSNIQAWHHEVWVEVSTTNATAANATVQGKLAGSTYWANATSVNGSMNGQHVSFDGYYSEIRVVSDTGLIFTLHHVFGGQD
jgi:hypothetical protein